MAKALLKIAQPRQGKLGIYEDPERCKAGTGRSCATFDKESARSSPSAEADLSVRSSFLTGEPCVARGAELRNHLAIKMI